ncbi:hypothetical protein N7466_005974 [Penicillium verhagenii]|uniref:uncharacterized protein n=1 Tax=Penicillium verhagenii TaxID=1562060 RepID=UPI002545B054|nr:uncharacterized protein N7466_005974 [Penicillium verhagenii]KAJ5930481.1 hypothetical protein N7466_005974 [Penicillium verhagenii]
MAVMKEAMEKVLTSPDMIEKYKGADGQAGPTGPVGPQGFVVQSGDWKPAEIGFFDPLLKSPDGVLVAKFKPERSEVLNELDHASFGWPQIRAGKSVCGHAYNMVRLLKALGTYSEADQVLRILDLMDAGLARDLLPADVSLSTFITKLDSYERTWKRQSAERTSRIAQPTASTNRKPRKALGALPAANEVYNQSRPHSGREARLPPADQTPQAPTDGISNSGNAQATSSSEFGGKEATVSTRSCRKNPLGGPRANRGHLD